MYVHNIARRPVVLDGMIDDLWQAYVKKDSTLRDNRSYRMIDYMNGYRFNNSDWTKFFKKNCIPHTVFAIMKGLVYISKFELY